MKRILAGLLAITMVFGAGSMPKNSGVAPNTAVAASPYEQSGDFEYIVFDDSYVVITDYTGSDENLVIPATLEGYPVDSVGLGDEANRTAIKSLTIQEGVKLLHGNAFAGCTNLETVNLPSSINFAYADSFKDTKWFNDLPRENGLVIADNILFKAESVGSTVDVPAGVKVIAGYAFEGTNVEKVNLPDGVETIAAGAFESCSKLGQIKLPEGVTLVGVGAFRGCPKLQVIYLPSTVETVEFDAFEECLSITDVYYAGSLGQWKNVSVGSGNYEFKAADMHFSVEPTNEELFDYEEIEGEIYINDYDNSVTNLVVPAYLDSKPVRGFSDSFSGHSDLKSLTVEEGVSEISDMSFEGCGNLVSVNLPSTITYVGRNAFDSTPFIGSLPKQNGLTLIGDIVIKSDNVSGEIEVPNGVRVLAVNAFADNSLSSVKLPDSLKYINDSAFSSCLNLNEITLPDSVVDLGDFAFYNCIGLTDVDLPNSIPYIRTGTFYGCTSLKNVYLPEELEIISAEAFRQSGIEDIFLPDTLMSIGDNAFSHSQLKTVALPENVNALYTYAFAVCQDLETVYLPKSLHYIDEGAFYYCPNITDVYYAGTEAEWNEINISTQNDDLTNANIHFAGEDETDYSAYTATIIAVDESDAEHVLYSGSFDTNKVEAYIDWADFDFPRDDIKVMKAVISNDSLSGQIDRLNLSVTIEGPELGDVSRFETCLVENGRYSRNSAGMLFTHPASVNAYDSTGFTVRVEIGSEDITPISGTQATYEDFLYSTNETGDCACVEMYYGSENMIVIPKTINGAEVFSLGENFLRYSEFGDFTNQKAVTIPNNVQRIFADPSNFGIIFCQSGSYAEEFAKENNIMYQIIDVYPGDEPVQEPITGDIDGDNMLSYVDVSFLVDAVSYGVSPQVLASADMDGNDQIDYIDVSMLIDKINNN